MTTANNKKSIKTAVVVTYIIALLVLIAGWFAPAFGFDTGMELVDTMMFWYVPALINTFLYPFTGSNLIPIEGKYAELPSFANYGGQLIPDVDLQMTALLLLVYLVITALGIIFLIPVLAGNREKKTSLVCAYVIEGAAAFALALMVAFVAYAPDLPQYGFGRIVLCFLNVICVLGATLIIIAIQAMVAKRSYGFAQVVLCLLSLAAIMFACLDLDYIIGLGVGDGWADFLDMINVQEGFISLVYLLPVVGLMVWGMVNGDFSYIWNDANTVTINILNVALFALFVVLVLNVIIDFIGVMAGNKTKNGVILAHKGGKIFGLVRYLIALALLIVVLVLTIVEKLWIGFSIYAVILFVALAVIIDIVRLCRVPAQKRKAAEQQQRALTISGEGIDDENEEATDLVGDNVIAQPAPAAVYTETAAEPQQMTIAEIPAEETAEEPVVEETPAEPLVYTPRPVVYNGPTDDFLDTLTTEEKIEFSKAFIDKTKGNLPANMPEYDIGGQNDDFFPAIFLNLGRFRAMLSSGLMRKIYKYLNSK